MVKRLIIMSQKGGVGKSTSTAIVSEMLAHIGYKVLVVDLDTQGNATQMLTGKNIYTFSGNTIMEAVKEHNAAGYTIQVKDRLSLIPAEDMLATFSRYIYTNNIREPLRVIQQTLEPIENEYDFIFLDCPPNLGDIVLNAVIYADYVVVPVDSGAFALDALSRFIDFINGAKAEGHTHAEILGVLMTIKDSRSNHEKSIIEEIRNEYGDLVFKTEIKKRAKIKEMALSGADLKSREHLTALVDYFNLTEEVIKRVE